MVRKDKRNPILVYPTTLSYRLVLENTKVFRAAKMSNTPTINQTDPNAVPVLPEAFKQGLTVHFFHGADLTCLGHCYL